MNGQTSEEPVRELARMYRFCCGQVTAYSVGFEHMRYLGIYWNPYEAGTPERVQYIDGHEDARREMGLAA